MKDIGERASASLQRVQHSDVHRFSSISSIPKESISKWSGIKLLRTLLRLFARTKKATLLFSYDSKLFGKNTRGGVPPSTVLRCSESRSPAQVPAERRRR